MKKNEDVRKYARSKGIPFWQIAISLNISEATFTRWLRTELAPERRALIMKQIDELSSIDLDALAKKEG